MRIADDYAHIWCQNYRGKAEADGWVLAYHTSDECYELERIDDTDAFDTDDDVIKYVVERIAEGPMYYMAFYLDRRSGNSRCWIPIELLPQGG